MAGINQMLERIKSVNVTEESATALDANAKEIIDLQKVQLLKGVKADGKKIGKYKNNSYAAKKFSQNPLAGFGNVDLKLTGDFAFGIFVDVRTQSFVIDSQDNKTDKIFKRYGDPFGLNKKSKVELIPPLKKTMVKNIKNKLRL